jgi:uncharacterized protein (DUF1810 family)
VSDSLDLRRFMEAQTSVYPRGVRELSAGKKRSHRMWFVFPQIAGLGFSAGRSGSRSVRAAKQPPLSQEVFGPRLVGCTRLVMAGSKKVAPILRSVD